MIKGGIKGGPRTPGSGRKKGTLNKATREVAEILNEKGFSVIHELINLYQDSKLHTETYSTAAKCLTEIASFVYQKRKAVEYSGDIDLKSSDGSMSPQVVVMLPPKDNV